MVAKDDSASSSGGPPRVSVVVCAHNSEDRLPETLLQLGQQTLAPAAWDLIVVDNCSTDATAEVARRFAPQSVSLRVVRQERLGLAWARQAGVHYARGEFLVFVDDDNWLDADYLETVLQRFDTDPQLGIVGGRSTAVCESEPPRWFEEYGTSLAVGQPTDDPPSVDTTFVWGAGMALRSDVARAVLEHPIMSGRAGTDLVSGEDIEMCLRTRHLGYRVSFDPALHLHHVMPSTRLRWDYILAVQRGWGRSTIQLGLLRDALTGERSRSWYNVTEDALREYLRGVVRKKIGRGSWEPGGRTAFDHAQIAGRLATLVKLGPVGYRRILRQVEQTSFSESRAARSRRGNHRSYPADLRVQSIDADGQRNFPSGTERPR